MEMNKLKSPERRGQGMVLVSSAATALCLTIGAGQAATLFEQSFTGADLAAGGTGITLFETPTVTGTQADFTNGTSANSPMVEIDLLPSATRGDVIVNVTLDYDALTSDNDMYWGVSDGTNFAGWERADNSGGSWYARSGSATGVPSFSQQQTGLGTLETLSATFTIFADNSAELTSVTEGADSFGPFAYTEMLDSDNALSFRLYREGLGEDYRINALSFLITDADGPSTPVGAVPLPASLPLLLAGFGGLFALRRRRALS